jgi:hypothetical protein
MIRCGGVFGGSVPASPKGARVGPPELRSKEQAKSPQSISIASIHGKQSMLGG